MKLLVDTHAMLWFLTDDPRLSGKARAVLTDPAVEAWWSVASSFELGIKVAVGKLRPDRGLAGLLDEIVAGQGLSVRPITHADCVQVALLPLHHRDPFDRMLVVQAQVDGVALLSTDPALRAYDVDLVW